MAWLETDRHGRLRIAFKYYDGRTYREPLGVEASKRTRVDAERLSSMIQLELSAGSFDYAKRFPNSERVKKLGLKRPEQQSRQTLKDFAEAAWLPEKRLEVKRSTFVYYNEIYKPHIEKAEWGRSSSLKSMTRTSISGNSRLRGSEPRRRNRSAPGARI